MHYVWQFMSITMLLNAKQNSVLKQHGSSMSNVNGKNGTRLRRQKRQRGKKWTNTQVLLSR